MAGSRATRITKPFADVMVMIIARSKVGKWTEGGQLLHIRPGSVMGHTPVYNALRSAMKHGLLERTETRPYKYRLRSGLSADDQAFLREIQERWVAEYRTGAALDEDVMATLDDAEAAVVADVNEDRQFVEIPYSDRTFVISSIEDGGDQAGVFRLSPKVKDWLSASNITEWRAEFLFGFCRLTFEKVEHAVMFKLAWG